MTENNSRYENPVAKATQDFGGQHRFALLMQVFGVQVHRQTVFNWVKAGSIPHQYERAIRLIVKKYGHTLRDPSGLESCVRSSHTLNGAVSAPNEALESFIISKGGISAMVKEMNVKIAAHNEDGRIHVPNFLPLPKWTYVMIHNWLKRGRVSDGFRRVMREQFGCPDEIMGPEIAPIKPAALTAEELLGE